MPSFEVINPPNHHPTTGYSHAVRHGDTVYVAGQVAQDASGKLVGKDDPLAQAVQVLENLRLVLEASGSGLDRILKLTTYTTRLEYRDAIREARARVFGPLGYFPPNTFVVIQSLATPDYLVEIEAIAAVR